MARLSKIIPDIIRNRHRWEQHLPKLDGDLFSGLTSELRTSVCGVGGDKLSEVVGFGSNPGNLRMLKYIPEGLARSAPLVVLLHGCTQTAAGYDLGSGWSRLAKQHGFGLLLPEQQRTNNPNMCFSWFQTADTERNAGEALSIRQMIESVTTEHKFDAKQTYITGLSAGGAMTSAMLAVYPEVFAGGAIIAGLPFRAASNVQEAFSAMSGGSSSMSSMLPAGLGMGQLGSGQRSAGSWGDAVRAASPYSGPWPKISIWHGDADATVNVSNGHAIAQQWCDVHGVPGNAAVKTKVDGHQRSAWVDAKGATIIEAYSIKGLGHGVPIDFRGRNGEPCGLPDAFFLDAGIGSTSHIAKFWGLTGAARKR